jgi:alpha-tubulin suppressor-like RCC1 family protein
MGDNLPTVNLGTGRTALAISRGYHACVLLNGGDIKCWGMNSHGQLGLGDTNVRGDNPGEMGDNLPTVNLGTGKTATAVVVGIRHTCALLNDGTVKCWGGDSNSSGAVGLGDTNSRGDNPGEMGDNLPVVNLGTGKTAVAISSHGGYHTCALLNDGTVKCWGANESGQLGLGDIANRGDGPGEMGDALPNVLPF